MKTQDRKHSNQRTNARHQAAAPKLAGKRARTSPRQSSVKTEAKTGIVEQPQPFTPGLTRLMVREHARLLYRDKLQHSKLTLQDWVLAENDLVKTMDAEGLSAG